METKNKKSFIVFLPDKTVKFPQLRGGLYARNPQESKLSFQLSSISKNKKKRSMVKEKNKKAEAAKKCTKSNGMIIPRGPKKGIQFKSN